MKGLNQLELQQISDEIQTWVGAQLQEVIASETHVALGLYHERDVRWFVFDFAPQSPLFLILSEAHVRRLKKTTKPITLFLRAHFVGKRISNIELVKDQGRVLRIHFQDRYLEIILFSYAKNFTAVFADKKISFFKPKDVLEQSSQPKSESAMTARSFLTIENEWLSEKGLSPDSQEKNTPDHRKDKILQAIQKKSQALEKMQADIVKKKRARWAEAGELLKLSQSLNILKEFLEWVNLEKSLSENITNCFQKAKDLNRKLKVAEERAFALTIEIQKLNLSLTENEHVTLAHPPPKKNFLKKLGVQARTFNIDESLNAYIGKSAKDNLDILRRAQPFDYWLHIRDIPSAHVVIRRTRDRKVTDAELGKIARWLIAENFGKKAKEKLGEYFDIIICECRYVKPIKGDKLGRVNYQNDRTLRVHFISES